MYDLNLYKHYLILFMQASAMHVGICVHSNISSGCILLKLTVDFAMAILNLSS